MKAEPALVRQTDLAFHSEVSSYARRSSFRLPPADANRVVITGGNSVAPAVSLPWPHLAGARVR